MALRSLLVFALCASAIDAFAQPQLVFTLATPERTPSRNTLQASAVVEERGLVERDGVRLRCRRGVVGSSMDDSFGEQHDDVASRQPRSSCLSAN